MSTPNQPESSPAADGEINVTPGIEEKLQHFWLRNQRGLLALGVIVLLAAISFALAYWHRPAPATAPVWSKVASGGQRWPEV